MVDWLRGIIYIEYMIETKSATKRVTIYKQDAIDLQTQALQEERNVADIIHDLRRKVAKNPQFLLGGSK